MHEKSARGGGRGRRVVVIDFPPALIKGAIATYDRILQEAPPGTPGAPFSPALRKHAREIVHQIILLSMKRARPYLTPRPKRGR
jgi:hypothetical protein